MATNKAWFSGVLQCTRFNANGKEKAINAPRGLVDNPENLIKWQYAVEDALPTVTAIRSLEEVYLYSESLIKWRTDDDKAGVAMSSACDEVWRTVRAFRDEDEEIDRDTLKDKLTAWIASACAESDAEIDPESVDVSKKRVDDFITLIGCSRAKNTVSDRGRVVSGNRSTVIKSGASFMRALCQWTVDVSQRKYRPEVRLVAQ